MTIYAGTSGFSYKEWKGVFYPEKTPAKAMLAYYASQLPTVEINATFYRLPKAETLESWRDETPDDFRFSIKASQRITHRKRLKDAGEETLYLMETVRALGDKLGVVLFQTPPNLKCDLDRFDAFLELLPEDVRSAFEFRHDSWLDDAVYERLRARNHALVLADVDDAPEPDLLETADWGYLRLRREQYDDDGLSAWRKKVESTGWSDAYVFFKHEDAGTGPRYATTFLTSDDH